MPDVGIQVPPNLADWWPELVARGRDRPRRAVAPTATTSRPSTRSRRRTRCASASQQDGVALTERLCVYPRYIDPEWIAQGVLDVIKTQLLELHPAPRLRPARRAAGALRPDTIARARDGEPLDAATS